jgi:hypothetical protein
MSATYQLTDGTTTLDLQTANSYVARYSGFDAKPPLHDITWAGSRFRDGSLPAFSHRDNRTITVKLRIEGTSSDNLIDNYSAAAKMCAESTRYFRTAGAEGKKCRLLQKLNGGTNSVEYTVLAGDVDPGDYATVVPSRSFKLPEAEIKLTCLPFAEETSDVTATATGQTNSGVSQTLTSVRGEVETPAQFKIKHNSGALTPRIWIARRSRGTVANFLYKMEADVASAGATTSFSAASAYDVTDLASAGAITYTKQTDAAQSGERTAAGRTPAAAPSAPSSKSPAGLSPATGRTTTACSASRRGSRPTRR